MNNSTTISLREREREREDNNTLNERKKTLSVASFLKKSFSLVEAAIYLMLVGVLTMAVIGGAALVEKAKIQKVIEDIDYYEKAFVQFTIRFGQTPGLLTLQRCNENIDVFKVCKEYQKNKNSNLSSNYVWSDRGQLMFAPLQLQTSGYINTSKWNMEQGVTSSGRQNYSYDFAINNMTVSYTKNARADFYSPDCYAKPKGWGDYATHGGRDYFNKFRDMRYSKGDNSREGVVLVFFANSKLLTQVGGWGIKRDGLFTSKTMEKIDKKFDDGMPRKGKIQAIKQGTGASQYCYDQEANTYEKSNPAKYYGHNKVKQGCDLLYFLPDVSSYVY